MTSSNQAKNWFQPGVGGNPSGRPKGTPNKLGATIKEMVEKALHKAGGVDYLTDQAHKNPVAFLGLVGRVLPLQLAGHDGGRLEVEFRWRDESQTVTINGVSTDVGHTNVSTGDSDTPAITFIGEC